MLGILQNRCQAGGTAERLKLKEIDRSLLGQRVRCLGLRRSGGLFKMLDARTHDSSVAPSQIFTFVSLQVSFPGAADGLIPARTWEIESFSYRWHWVGQGVYVVKFLGDSMGL